MRGFIAVIMLIVITGYIQSCKEGCKDKNALNYNSSAKVENGTCLYCKTSGSIDSGIYTVTDFRAPFPYSQTGTFQFSLTVTDTLVSGNGCQSVGLQNFNGCKNYLRMTNLTNKTAIGNFIVTFQQNGFNLWFYSKNQQIVLAPGASTNFGFVDTGCSNLVTGSLFLQNSNFTYN